MQSRRRRTWAIAALLASLPAVALAHHGQDFLLVESAGVPHPGDAYFIADGSMALDHDADAQGHLEPALLVGLSHRLAFELHAHTEKTAGEGWGLEATAPALHLLLTDPGSHAAFKAGLSIEYEIAAHAGAPDNAELRLSVEHTAAGGQWGANLIASHEPGGDSDFGSALGYRHEVRTGFALGAEGQWSFRRAAGSEVTATAYFEHGQAWGLKFGLGGLRGERGHVTPVAHASLVLRLRD